VPRRNELAVAVWPASWQDAWWLPHCLLSLFIYTTSPGPHRGPKGSRRLSGRNPIIITCFLVKFSSQGIGCYHVTRPAGRASWTNRRSGLRSPQPARRHSRMENDYGRVNSAAWRPQRRRKGNWPFWPQGGKLRGEGRRAGGAENYCEALCSVAAELMPQSPA